MDFQWVADPRMVGYGLTAVRGVAAGELLVAAGADASEGLVADAAAAEELWFERDVPVVRAATSGAWSILIEPYSLQGADPVRLATWSRRSEAVSVFHTGSGIGGFLYAADGFVVTAFEPARPGVRSGTEADLLVEDMRAVGLVPEDGVGAPCAELELVARLTGVRLTAELVFERAWPVAFLPPRRRRR